MTEFLASPSSRAVLISSRFRSCSSHDAVFDGIFDENAVYMNVVLLADPVGSVYGLHLDVWIPKGVEHDNMRCDGKVQAGVASSQGDKHNLRLGILHEVENGFVALVSGHAAIERQY